MNNSFSFNRFKMVVRWDFLSNRKQYFSSTVGLAIGIFIMYLLAFQSYRAALKSTGEVFTQETIVDLTQGCGRVVVMIAVIALFALAANIFKNMRSKQQREAFLMLPASNIEKYLVRLFCMTIGGIVMMFVAIVISDAIIFVFNLMFASGCYSSLTVAGLQALFGDCTNCVVVNGDTLQAAANSNLATWILFIFTHSFFTLSGAFFNRHPVILAFCTGLIVGGFLMFGAFEGCSMINPAYCNSSSVFSTIFLVMLLILTVFNYWASYKLFTRMQIICNKWINL